MQIRFLCECGRQLTVEPTQAGLKMICTCGRSEEELTDRSRNQWDDEPRRPLHADKRKALQREVLRGEIEAVLAGPPSKQRFRELAEHLLDLAA